MKFKLNGCLDDTFDGDGVVELPDYRIPRAIALQPDGDLVVAADEYGDELHVLRFDHAGQPDATWSGDGEAATSWGGNSNFPTNVTVLPDGRVRLLFRAVREWIVWTQGQRPVVLPDPYGLEVPPSRLVLSPDGSRLLIGQGRSFASTRKRWTSTP